MRYPHTFIKNQKLFSLIFISFLGISVFGQIKMNATGEVGIGGYSATVSYDLRAQRSYSNTARIESLGIGADWSSQSPLYVYAEQTPTAIRAIGNIYCSGSYNSSDQNLKKNIQSLDKNDLLSKIKNIQGWSYEFKDSAELMEMHNNRVFKFHADSISTGKDKPKKARVYLPYYSAGKHYGLIAQNVKTEFPELVKMDTVSMVMSVNYDGFIPILLDVVKAQQEQIEDMESRISALENRNNEQSKDKNATFSDIATKGTDIATLYQNTPNPFTYQTEIAFHLTESITKANIYVFNMQGTLVKTYPLTQRGNGTLTINGGELQAGMYFYTLTTDGKEVDTKKMILTE